MISQNLQAFLDMIAFSEIGSALLAESDDGYDVLVGSTPANPHLFQSYDDHPRILVSLGNGLKSTAAGRYQILARYFDVYKVQLGLPDFGHESQDKIAIQMIGECKALTMIENGHIATAIAVCSSRWASLPGAPYGQHMNSADRLLVAYQAAGGAAS